MAAAPYTKNYYDTFDQTTLEIDPIVSLMVDMISPSSVIDVGCGVGNWLVAFRKCGVQTLQGIDGTYISPAWLKIPPEHFRAMDLNNPQPVSEKFDLAISLEVAEHLKPANAANFVRFLTSLAPIVLFSAASPYQGGTQHLNEQWPSYWAELFAKNDYSAIDCIRKHIWNAPEIPYYYRQNILVFAHKPVIEQNATLKREQALTHYGQLDLVHPQMLENIYLKRAIKLLGQSYENAIRKRRTKKALV